MKILLIYPYCLEKRLNEDDVSVVPIGLYYVGSLLKQSGFDVDIVNLFDMGGRPAEIRRILQERRPQVIGLSLVHANRWGGIEIARLAKKILPEVKIVAGGIGATFLWRHLLTDHREIDYCIVGEGEHPFLELVRHFDTGKPALCRDIRGIAFREGDRILTTGAPEPIKNLDDLPDPATDFSFQHVVSTRGCPGNCTFCGSPRFWGRKVRFHSPEYFVGQIETLYKKGIRFFYISDDTFTIDKNRVIAICRMILERRLRITWAAISRVNYVGEEMLAWMRRAGCIQISFGVEHGSPAIRDRLQKNIRTDAIKRAFSLTTGYGILARAYFIYGCPGETDGTIRETIDLIEEIAPLSVIFYILDLFPGTALYEEFKKRTGRSDDIWRERIEDILYFETDPALSREDILRYGRQLRKAFYEGLPAFAERIDLVDDPELFPLHADFLSRIGMTFSHGDYATIDAIPDQAATAERLFRRALTYHPDHRAYLGLGMVTQTRRAFRKSLRILAEGMEYFPDSEPLATCMGISYMNLGEFDRALPLFARFTDSPAVAPYLAECRKRVGQQGASLRNP
jgi:anaerobic magnesium-protoporphyrin IX monomethyl ester cyclase